MERMNTNRTKEVSPHESDDAPHFGGFSGANQRRGKEAPELLGGYLRRLDRGTLLTPEEELDLGRRTRAGDARARARLIERRLGSASAQNTGGHHPGAHKSPRIYSEER
jgi:DNA-directed RNA polymerase sigma subunit (sigma70/sigma32)